MWTFINCALSILAVAAAVGDIEIVGGFNIDISQAPFQISLRLNGGHICGGAIISNTHILTAAHCVHNLPTASFTVNAGSTNNKVNGVVVSVSRITMHPSYIGISNNHDHDLAVLKLAQPLPNTNKIQIISMAAQGSEVPAGQTVQITGWGWTSSAPPPRPLMENNKTVEYAFSDTLKAVNLAVVDNASCKALGMGVTNNMMCAGGKGEASCSGDSGGPAQAQNVLVGIVSWGADGSCVQQGRPSVQARVGAMRNWINSQMN